MARFFYRLILACVAIGMIAAITGPKSVIPVAAVLAFVAIAFAVSARSPRSLAGRIVGSFTPRGSRGGGGVNLGSLDERLSEIRESSARLPDPPRVAEYRAAGVSVTACTRCQKPLKSMGYFFGLDGRPTVYCPSCWSKATSPMQDGGKLDAWWDRLTTKYDRREL